MSLPLVDLGFTRGGLLWSVLEHSAVPLPYLQLARLKVFLPRFASSNELLGLLNRSPSSMNQENVRRMFSLMEDVLALHLSGHAPYQSAQCCRYIFDRHDIPLGDGYTMRNSGFHTQLPSYRRLKKTRIIDIANVSTDDSLKAVDFDSLQDLKARTNHKIRSAKQRIIDVCFEYIEKYTQICRELETADNCGSAGLSPKLLKKLSKGKWPHALATDLTPLLRLQAAILLIKSNKDLSCQRTFRLEDFPQLAPLTISSSTESLNEILLCRTFLPRTIVFSCLAILLAESGLNKQVLKSLDPANITKSHSGYRLVGIKGKTDQLQERNIFSTDPADHEGGFTIISPAAVKALDLLMQNTANFEAAGHLPTGIFSILRLRARGDLSPGGPAEIDELDIHHTLKECDPRWNFKLPSLRNLALQEQYTRPLGDIFSAAAYAGHASPDTTRAYLESTVINWMHESNMNRYIKMLGASILWTIGREKQIKEHNLEKFITPSLLFPLPTHAANTKAAAIDAWIESAGKLKLVIGAEEIHQVALQYKYYQLAARDLANSNPIAFVKNDLPRIAICQALRQIILSSPHKGILRAFEETINVPH